MTLLESKDPHAGGLLSSRLIVKDQDVTDPSRDLAELVRRLAVTCRRRPPATNDVADNALGVSAGRVQGRAEPCSVVDLSHRPPGSGRPVSSLDPLRSNTVDDQGGRASATYTRSWNSDVDAIYKMVATSVRTVRATGSTFEGARSSLWVPGVDASARLRDGAYRPFLSSYDRQVTFSATGVLVAPNGGDSVAVSFGRTLVPVELQRLRQSLTEIAAVSPRFADEALAAAVVEPPPESPTPDSAAVLTALLLHAYVSLILYALFLWFAIVNPDASSALADAAAMYAAAAATSAQAWAALKAAMNRE